MAPTRRPGAMAYLSGSSVNLDQIRGLKWNQTFMVDRADRTAPGAAVIPKEGKRLRDRGAGQTDPSLRSG